MSFANREHNAPKNPAIVSDLSSLTQIFAGDDLSITDISSLVDQPPVHPPQSVFRGVGYDESGPSIPSSLQRPAPDSQSASHFRQADIRKPLDLLNGLARPVKPFSERKSKAVQKNASQRPKVSSMKTASLSNPARVSSATLSANVIPVSPIASSVSDPLIPSGISPNESLTTETMMLLRTTVLSPPIATLSAASVNPTATTTRTGLHNATNYPCASVSASCFSNVAALPRSSGKPSADGLPKRAPSSQASHSLTNTPNMDILTSTGSSLPTTTTAATNTLPTTARNTETHTATTPTAPAVGTATAPSMMTPAPLPRYSPPESLATALAEPLPIIPKKLRKRRRTQGMDAAERNVGDVSMSSETTTLPATATAAMMVSGMSQPRLSPGNAADTSIRNNTGAGIGTLAGTDIDAAAGTGIGIAANKAADKVTGQSGPKVARDKRADQAAGKSYAKVTAGRRSSKATVGVATTTTTNSDRDATVRLRGGKDVMVLLSRDRDGTSTASTSIRNSMSAAAARNSGATAVGTSAMFAPMSVSSAPPNVTHSTFPTYTSTPTSSVTSISASMSASTPTLPTCTSTSTSTFTCASTSTAPLTAAYTTVPAFTSTTTALFAAATTTTATAAVTTPVTTPTPLAHLAVAAAPASAVAVEEVEGEEVEIVDVDMIVDADMGRAVAMDAVTFPQATTRIPSNPAPAAANGSTLPTANSNAADPSRLPLLERLRRRALAQSGSEGDTGQPSSTDHLGARAMLPAMVRDAYSTQETRTTRSRGADNTRGVVGDSTRNVSSIDTSGTRGVTNGTQDAADNNKNIADSRAERGEVETMRNIEDEADAKVIIGEVSLSGAMGWIQRVSRGRQPPTPPRTASTARTHTHTQVQAPWSVSSSTAVPDFVMSEDEEGPSEPVPPQRPPTSPRAPPLVTPYQYSLVDLADSQLSDDTQPPPAFFASPLALLSPPPLMDASQSLFDVGTSPFAHDAIAAERVTTAAFTTPVEHVTPETRAAVTSSSFSSTEESLLTLENLSVCAALQASIGPSSPSRVAPVIKDVSSAGTGTRAHVKVASKTAPATTAATAAPTMRGSRETTRASGTETGSVTAQPAMGRRAARERRRAVQSRRSASGSSSSSSSSSSDSDESPSPPRTSLQPTLYSHITAEERRRHAKSSRGRARPPSAFEPYTGSSGAVLVGGTRTLTSLAAPTSSATAAASTAVTPAVTGAAARGMATGGADEWALLHPPRLLPADKLWASARTREEHYALFPPLTSPAASDIVASASTGSGAGTDTLVDASASAGTGVAADIPGCADATAAVPVDVDTTAAAVAAAATDEAGADAETQESMQVRTQASTQVEVNSVYTAPLSARVTSSASAAVRNVKRTTSRTPPTAARTASRTPPTAVRTASRTLLPASPPLMDEHATQSMSQAQTQTPRQSQTQVHSQTHGHTQTQSRGQPTQAELVAPVDGGAGAGAMPARMVDDDAVSPAHTTLHPRPAFVEPGDGGAALAVHRADTATDANIASSALTPPRPSDATAVKAAVATSASLEGHVMDEGAITDALAAPAPLVSVSVDAGVGQDTGMGADMGASIGEVRVDEHGMAINECSSCTYHNSRYDSACAMCGSSLSESLRVPALAAAPGPALNTAAIAVAPTIAVSSTPAVTLSAAPNAALDTELNAAVDLLSNAALVAAAMPNTALQAASDLATNVVMGVAVGTVSNTISDEITAPPNIVCDVAGGALNDDFDAVPPSLEYEDREEDARALWKDIPALHEVGTTATQAVGAVVVGMDSMRREDLWDGYLGAEDEVPPLEDVEDVERAAFTTHAPTTTTSAAASTGTTVRVNNVAFVGVLAGTNAWKSAFGEAGANAGTSTGTSGCEDMNDATDTEDAEVTMIHVEPCISRTKGRHPNLSTQQVCKRDSSSSIAAAPPAAAAAATSSLTHTPAPTVASTSSSISTSTPVSTTISTSPAATSTAATDAAAVVSSPSFTTPSPHTTTPALPASTHTTTAPTSFASTSITTAVAASTHTSPDTNGGPGRNTSTGADLRMDTGARMTATTATGTGVVGSASPRFPLFDVTLPLLHPSNLAPILKHYGLAHVDSCNLAGALHHNCSAFLSSWMVHPELPHQLLQCLLIAMLETHYVSAALGGDTSEQEQRAREHEAQAQAEHERLRQVEQGLHAEMEALRLQQRALEVQNATLQQNMQTTTHFHAAVMLRQEELHVLYRTLHQREEAIKQRETALQSRELQFQKSITDAKAMVAGTQQQEAYLKMHEKRLLEMEAALNGYRDHLLQLAREHQMRAAREAVAATTDVVLQTRVHDALVTLQQHGQQLSTLQENALLQARNITQQAEAHAQRVFTDTVARAQAFEAQVREFAAKVTQQSNYVNARTTQMRAAEAQLCQRSDNLQTKVAHTGGATAQKTTPTAANGNEATDAEIEARRAEALAALDAELAERRRDMMKAMHTEVEQVRNSLLAQHGISLPQASSTQQTSVGAKLLFPRDAGSSAPVWGATTGADARANAGAGVGIDAGANLATGANITLPAVSSSDSLMPLPTSDFPSLSLPLLFSSSASSATAANTDAHTNLGSLASPFIARGGKARGRPRKVSDTVDHQGQEAVEAGSQSVRDDIRGRGRGRGRGKGRGRSRGRGLGHGGASNARELVPVVIAVSSDSPSETGSAAIAIGETDTTAPAITEQSGVEAETEPEAEREIEAEAEVTVRVSPPVSIPFVLDMKTIASATDTKATLSTANALMLSCAIEEETLLSTVAAETSSRVSGLDSEPHNAALDMGCDKIRTIVVCKRGGEAQDQVVDTSANITQDKVPAEASAKSRTLLRLVDPSYVASARMSDGSDITFDISPPSRVPSMARHPPSTLASLTTVASSSPDNTPTVLATDITPQNAFSSLVVATERLAGDSGHAESDVGVEARPAGTSAHINMTISVGEAHVSDSVSADVDAHEHLRAHAHAHSLVSADVDAQEHRQAQVGVDNASCTSSISSNDGNIVLAPARRATQHSPTRHSTSMGLLVTHAALVGQESAPAQELLAASGEAGVGPHASGGVNGTDGPGADNNVGGDGADAPTHPLPAVVAGSRHDADTDADTDLELPVSLRNPQHAQEIQSAVTAAHFSPNLNDNGATSPGPKPATVATRESHKFGNARALPLPPPEVVAVMEQVLSRDIHREKDTDRGSNNGGGRETTFSVANAMPPPPSVRKAATGGGVGGKAPKTLGQTRLREVSSGGMSSAAEESGWTTSDAGTHTPKRRRVRLSHTRRPQSLENLDDDADDRDSDISVFSATQRLTQLRVMSPPGEDSHTHAQTHLITPPHAEQALPIGEGPQRTPSTGAKKALAPRLAADDSD